MKRKILLGALLALIVIQFFPIDETNPKTDNSAKMESVEALSGDQLMLLKDACYDCHSNETSYPSYTRFQPVGWWTKGHVKGGRMKVNFSEWTSYDQKKRNHHLEESIEVLEESRMPLKSYTWLHPKSKINAEQKAELIALFKRLQK